MHSQLSSVVPLRSRAVRRFWPLLIVATSAILSATFACIVPFAAMVAVASRTMSWRAAAATLVGAVAANQAVGFLFLNYPHTFACVVWGPFFVVATLAALGVACKADNPALAAVGAFAAYETVLAAISFITEHSLAAYTPAIIGQVALSNVEGLIVLGLIYVALVQLDCLGVSRLPTSAERSMAGQ